MSRARDRELETLGVERTVEAVAATSQRSIFLIKELILTHTCSLAYYKYFWRRGDRCIRPIFLVETKQEVQLILVTSPILVFKKKLKQLLWIFLSNTAISWNKEDNVVLPRPRDSSLTSRARDTGSREDS
ncbi:hypothetical protein NDU88_000942 [Pleurodeles waltl]|uniref:Uncharacterized protein n=1 Tax=Pleurodeles waltl TaxID=8319 RepID=A0AAV7LB54_PLEWA|nr:hypothetical protein NDU88_000942 [Pleurodeles waltl]